MIISGQAVITSSYNTLVLVSWVLRSRLNEKWKIECRLDYRLHSRVNVQLNFRNFTIILPIYIIMSQQQPEAGPSTSPTPTILDETLNSLDIDDITESNTKVKSKNRKSKSKEPKPVLVPRVKAPKAPKPIPTPIQAFDDPAEGEEETVHGVYESIAPHFSQTRHKVCLE
jgi:hypothetical protein